MATSLDGECPSCHKRFENTSLVLRHMNNPMTSCASWHDFLESITREQPRHPPNHHPGQGPGTNNDTDDNDDADGNDADNANNDNNNSANHHTSTHYEDVHPNHSSIFAFGPGFMDTFNSDPSAEKRSVNIYYPFSSKEEWSLASWLLCSGLLMRAINDFLALPIVSLEFRVTAS